MACAFAVMLLWAMPAAAQFTLSTPDGSATLRFGMLAQPQMEWVEGADGDSASQDLFLRRGRFVMAGTVGENFSFFMGTISLNMGKAGADGRRNEPGLSILDFLLTYRLGENWHVDAGKMMVANSYNHGQGATTLLGIDRGPHVFTTSGPLGLHSGRDYGVAGRGYLAGNHLEVRAGVFQGVRGGGAENPFRLAARVVWYPFDAHTGFFYPGTAFGRRRVVGVGISHDRQRDYRGTGADVYVDLPVGENAVTGQVNFVRLDGGRLAPDLVRQNTLFMEAGYFLKSLSISPFVQFARRDDRSGTAVDEEVVLAGVAYWIDGHRLNVKLGAGTVKRQDGPRRARVVLQSQLYLF